MEDHKSPKELRTKNKNSTYCIIKVHITFNWKVYSDKKVISYSIWQSNQFCLINQLSRDEFKSKAKVFLGLPNAHRNLQQLPHSFAKGLTVDEP